MRPRLYVIPASPPCGCIEAALQVKGVAYDTTVLPNVLHVPHQLARFRKPTVPAITLGSESIVGSPEIMRRLEQLWPEPPLYPDPRVSEVEAWVVDELQPIGRKLAAWTTVRRPDTVPSFFEGADLVVPMPAPVLRAIAPVATRLGRLRNSASDESVREELRLLPQRLGRVERWIDEGLVGGDRPNAGDLQIASNLRLLLNFGDAAPIVERHPRAAALARRVFPDWPGHVPAGVVPAAWLP